MATPKLLEAACKGSHASQGGPDDDGSDENSLSSSRAVTRNIVGASLVTNGASIRAPHAPRSEEERRSLGAFSGSCGPLQRTVHIPNASQ